MTPLRQVRRLNLSVARRDDVGRSRIWLEDALRTASLGDEGRILIVRSLDLGSVSLRDGATAWSTKIEERMRQVRSLAVPARAPSAEKADAVYFDGPLEPWVQLALRVARGTTPTEWYWRTATPGWRPGMSARETLRWIFRTLAERGLPATLIVASRLQQASLLRAWTAVIERDDLAPLFSSFVSRLEKNRGNPIQNSGERKPFAPAETSRGEWRSMPAWIFSQLEMWGASDPRSLWLIATQLVPPTSFVVPSPDELARLVERAIDLTVAKTKVEQQPLVPEAPKKPDEVDDVVGCRGEPVPTQAGGLFFLVPLLVRTGFGTENSTEIDQGLGWEVLRKVLKKIDTNEPDELLRLLPESDASFEPGAVWRPILKATRLMRRKTKLSLTELVRRPALVSVNETHVDVFFRPDQADVRIRAAGLDVDPGWVPWLSRVVSFHFTRED